LHNENGDFLGLTWHDMAGQGGYWPSNPTRVGGPRAVTRGRPDVHQSHMSQRNQEDVVSTIRPTSRCPPAPRTHHRKPPRLPVRWCLIGALGSTAYQAGASTSGPLGGIAALALVVGVLDSVLE